MRLRSIREYPEKLLKQIIIFRRETNFKIICGTHEFVVYDSLYIQKIVNDVFYLVTRNYYAKVRIIPLIFGKNF